MSVTREKLTQFTGHSGQPKYRYRNFQQTQAISVQKAVLRCPSKVTARQMMPTDPKITNKTTV